MKIYLSVLILSIILISCDNSGKNNPSEKKDSITYKIAYNIYSPDTITKNGWDIMSMNMNGSNKQNISNHKDVAWSYYAYKNRLFFISDKDTSYRCFFLYEMDADGKNIKKVSNLRLEDSWMSSRNDGNEMVVAGRIGKEIRYQLFILNTQTGEYKQLTNDTASMYQDPCFSPDGKQIVYAYKKNKRNNDEHEELYIMNEDGSNKKQLTYYPENNSSLKENGYKAGAPKWHPTENYITYISKQNGKHNIYAVKPDGKKQWKLTNNNFNEGWHDWSADGKWLVFDNADEEEKQYHIQLMNWETKEIKKLTDTTYHSQLAPVFVQIK